MATAAALQTELDNLRKKSKSEKLTAKERGESFMATLGTTYTMGYLEKKKVKLPKIKNVDQKLQYGALALAGSLWFKNKRTSRLLGAAGEGLLGVVAYEVGKHGAGELMVEGVSGRPAELTEGDAEEEADVFTEESEAEVVETGALG